MTEEEFDELLESIQEHGQLEPVLVFRRKNASVVIDGRNRLRACAKLGIEPILKMHRGKRDVGVVADLILALNLHRRHLPPARRVICTANLHLFVEKAEAAKRRRATQNNDAGRGEAANLPAQSQGQTREILAQKAGVSPRTVQSLLTVRERGVPELEEAVVSEGITLSAAEAISKLDPEGQREVLEKAKGAPRSVRRILRERSSKVPDVQADSVLEPASEPAPSAPFADGVEELKAHLRRARGACAALVQATPWPEDLGLEVRTAETDALMAAIDEVIGKTSKLGTGPGLRLVHGGAGDTE